MPVTNLAHFHFGVGDLVTLAHDRSKGGPVHWLVVGHQARWTVGGRAISYLIRSTQKEGYYDHPVKLVEAEASEAELILVAEKPAPAATSDGAAVPDLQPADHGTEL